MQFAHYLYHESGGRNFFKVEDIFYALNKIYQSFLHSIHFKKGRKFSKRFFHGFLSTKSEDFVQIFAQ